MLMIQDFFALTSVLDKVESSFALRDTKIINGGLVGD